MEAPQRGTNVAVEKTALKYSEPSDACAPPPGSEWRLYVFKGEEVLEPILLAQRSHFLVGRDRTVAHIPSDHPSCSSQHAAIQFRRKYVDEGPIVLPYVIDLESTNGTFLNGERMEPARYYELRNKDSLKFGQSTREYIVLLKGAMT